MTKRTGAAILLLALILVCGCARPLPAGASTPAPSPVPSPTATATATPRPSPTPMPTPMIGDAWYAARTEQMRVWMRQFGDYASERAIEEQLLLWDVDPDRPMIALTFDDGPVHGVTDKILDILARYNLRATFFVKGIHVEKGKDLLERAVAQGCEIANHTWSHKIMPNLDSETMRREIVDTNQAIYDVIGVQTHILRPPGGSCGGRVYAAGSKYEMAVVRWSQSGNVNLTDPAEIAATVMHQEVNGRDLRDGDIILLHDTHDYMVEAVELMVPVLLEHGYQFVTVTEMLMLSERGLVYGERYDHR